MKCERKRIIAHRKMLAAFHKACSIYDKYTVLMNDCNVVKKMIVEHGFSEEIIIKAITIRTSSQHAGKCYRFAKEFMESLNNKNALQW